MLMMQQRRGGARIYKGSTATSTTRSTTVMGQHRQRFRGIRSIAPDRPAGAGFKRESWHAGVRPAPRVIPWDARSTPSGHEVTRHSLSACQMRKNTNQTIPRIRTARAIETVRSVRTEGSRFGLARLGWRFDGSALSIFGCHFRNSHTVRAGGRSWRRG